MDIKELNNEFFSKCKRICELGYLYIDKNKYKFHDFLTKNTVELKSEDLNTLTDLNNKKINIRFLKSNIKIIVKRKIKPTLYNYIIIANENITFNNNALNYNSILLFMEDKIIEYNNLSPLFNIECINVERFNKDKAINEYKMGNTSNTIVRNQNILSNNTPTYTDASDQINELEKEFNTSSMNYTDNLDTEIDSNDSYQIICKLFKETSSGGTVLYGYRLLDSENSKQDEGVASVIQLASKHKIKNVKVVVKNGKRILQGINFKLDELPMEFI